MIGNCLLLFVTLLVFDDVKFMVPYVSVGDGLIDKMILDRERVFT